jgi:cation transport protein ChaC
MTEEPLWLFGYGSLLFKPPLHHMEISQDFHRFNGHVQGYIRRFWQSSYDNRGTPEFKGRVVTILPAHEVSTHSTFHSSVLTHELEHLTEEHALELLSIGGDTLAQALNVRGCVYRIPAEHAQAAREYLDFREKDGYTVEEIVFTVEKTESSHELLAHLPQDSEGRALIKCHVYVGTLDNESFVGPEELAQTANIIRKAIGPSGPNNEYLLLLQEQDPNDTYLTILKELVLKEET